mmetsp:Transcript_23876/g.77004  ORF Transcript_23876/g.77004 Transcript_23876/m.77004 type:complete len:94 (-) Transcript_23876:365-646(-)
MGHTNGDPRGRGREGNHGLRSTTDCAKLEREEGASQGGAQIRRHNTEPMLSVCDSTSSTLSFWLSPANSFSSVRKSMQWHSCRSRIGTHGQFQ